MHFYAVFRRERQDGIPPGMMLAAKWQEWVSLKQFCHPELVEGSDTFPFSEGWIITQIQSIFILQRIDVSRCV